MRRTAYFLAMLTAGLLGFALSLAWLVQYSREQSNSISITMGHMMRSPWVSSSGVPTYAWGLPLAFAALAIIGVAGVAYYLFFPEIRSRALHQSSANDVTLVMRALKPDERRVVEILRNHGGKRLQRDIRWEGSFSRLKTHRIVSRLAERGIVEVTPEGNTNLIRLANWVSGVSDQEKEGTGGVGARTG